LLGFAGVMLFFFIALGGVFSWTTPDVFLCICLAVFLSVPLLGLFGHAESLLQEAQDYIELRERGGKIAVTNDSLLTRLAERARQEAAAGR